MAGAPLVFHAASTGRPRKPNRPPLVAQHRGQEGSELDSFESLPRGMRRRLWFVRSMTGWRVLLGDGEGSLGLSGFLRSSGRFYGCFTRALPGLDTSESLVL